MLAYVFSFVRQDTRKQWCQEFGLEDFDKNLFQFSHIDSEGLNKDNLQIPEALESKLDPKLDYSKIRIAQRCNLNSEK